MAIGVIPSYTNIEDIQSNIFTRSDSFTIDNVHTNGTILLSGSTQTITVADVLKPGESINFIATGAGTKTFSVSGVTMNSAENKVTIDTQWAAASIFCRAAGAYVLIGKLA